MILCIYLSTNVFWGHQLTPNNCSSIPALPRFSKLTWSIQGCSQSLDPLDRTGHERLSIVLHHVWPCRRKSLLSHCVVQYTFYPKVCGSNWKDFCYISVKHELRWMYALGIIWNNLLNRQDASLASVCLCVLGEGSSQGSWFRVVCCSPQQMESVNVFICLSLKLKVLSLSFYRVLIAASKPSTRPHSQPNTFVIDHSLTGAWCHWTAYLWPWAHRDSLWEARWNQLSVIGNGGSVSYHSFCVAHMLGRETAAVRESRSVYR